MSVGWSGMCTRGLRGKRAGKSSWASRESEKCEQKLEALLRYYRTMRIPLTNRETCATKYRFLTATDG